MTNPVYKVKLSFVSGLRDIVLKELELIGGITVLSSKSDEICLSSLKNPALFLGLKSVINVSLFIQDEKFNPTFVSKHKSILDDLITVAFLNNKEKAKTFKIICAGSGSPEVRGLAKYISDKYLLSESEEADLKMYIIKQASLWDVGVYLSYRPLSVRSYRVANIAGAMNPTIAFAMNSLCGLDKASSYLNPFSGSGTLLIEAGLAHPNISKLEGFDKDKKHLTASIQNIRKAGLISKITVHERDAFDNPDLGKFDVIASDLPFGMVISKEGDLEKLYEHYIRYCESHLNVGGVMTIYTTEHELFLNTLKNSNFSITYELQLKFITNANSNIHPKIIVSRLRG